VWILTHPIFVLAKIQERQLQEARAVVRKSRIPVRDFYPLGLHRIDENRRERVTWIDAGAEDLDVAKRRLEEARDRLIDCPQCFQDEAMDNYEVAQQEYERALKEEALRGA
jgi:hypothetical protein